MVVFGPQGGLSRMSFQRGVYERIYPYAKNLPSQRRFCDGWSFVNANEFTTWQSNLNNIVLHGFLFNSSKDDPDSDKNETPIDGWEYPVAPDLDPEISDSDFAESTKNDNETNDQASDTTTNSASEPKSKLVNQSDNSGCSCSILF